MVFGKLLRLNKGILLAVLAIVLLAIATSKETVSKTAEPIWKIDANKLSDGDLIFRKGRDLVSRLVLSQGKSAQFSHVGVIVKNEGIVSVVHSLPEDVGTLSGVQIESLSSFSAFDNASDIAVYRLKGIDDTVRKKLIGYVLQQVGKPFDAGFLLSTDDSIYCTELAVKAFAYADVELGNLSPIEVMLMDERVIPPDHLRQSARFQRIKL